MYVDEAHPDVANIHLANNGLNGLRVFDASNVELYDVESINNGGQAVLPTDGIGLFFEKANDLMSSTKNVSCINVPQQTMLGAVYVKDSVDIQFHGLSVTDPEMGQAVEADNANLNFNGWVDIHGLDIQANRTGPAFQLLILRRESQVFASMVPTMEWFGMVERAR